MIVGDADDGPAPLPAANGGGVGDDDLPPDFDAMPMEEFEAKPTVVAAAAAVETMEVD